MSNRRTFFKTAAIAAGTAPLATAVCAKERTTTRSGVADYNYALPTLKKGCRLLFQGDSITDMKWGRNEKDRNHYLGHSYVFLIAARLGVELASSELEFFNRGNSGNTVANLRERWQKDAIDIDPDVLSILIGVNDVGRMIRGKQDHVPLDHWERNYRTILDASRVANPQLKIVLLDPFVLPSSRFSDGAHAKWRSEVDKLCKIVALMANDYEAVHIPTQQVFDDAVKTAKPEHWIWDGVHPLPQGHELIARTWIQRFLQSA
ncbi:SGNH/GDSL hydrolase family protein [Novipirellula sp. SH528]|uniref:SGNH/GDSL hydrolase family protein n=1 Tax=Novipirellula sp. SH528 TaxID=3454466 RepID=UPI003FA0D1E8